MARHGQVKGSASGSFVSARQSPDVRASPSLLAISIVYFVPRGLNCFFFNVMSLDPVFFVVPGHGTVQMAVF